MKVIFCIPALTGEIKTGCHQSLVSTYHILNTLGIEHDEFILENSPCLPDARSILEAMFMAGPENTDLFFVDSDVRFDAAAAVNILHRPEEIVAGIYPLKRERVGWPVTIKTRDGIPIGRDGLIEAEFMPTGFMRIKRSALERIRARYPELRYEDSVIEVTGFKVRELYDLFRMGFSPSGRRLQEDYSFCQRWTAIGGQLWVYPDVDFQHFGNKPYIGNYHEYLLRLPGGAKDPNAHLIEVPA